MHWIISEYTLVCTQLTGLWILITVQFSLNCEILSPCDQYYQRFNCNPSEIATSNGIDVHYIEYSVYDYARDTMIMIITTLHLA